MENSPQAMTTYAVPRMGFLAVFCAGLAGCAPLAPYVTSTNELPKSSTSVCQAVAQWSNHVHYEPDPINGGVPMPGIVGRLYLFDSEIKYPLVGDGGILVSLFDDSAGKPSEKPIEVWYIDPDTLQRLARKDFVGWGYTLFLPWSTYKREITNVHLTVRYDPKQGSPLYTPSAPLTLEHPMPPAQKMTNDPSMTKE
jgi:hypothetical protein